MDQFKESSRRKFLQTSVLATMGMTLNPAKMITHDDYESSKTKPVNNSKEITFFSFDDHSIPFTHNLKLSLVEAAKHPGNPVLRRGPAGSPDQGHAILYGTVIKDGDKFRMWYLGMFETNNDDDGQPPGYWRPMCYAESLDGINWIKPDLGLVTFNGNKHNNICKIDGNGKPHSWTEVDDFLSVLYEPDDPDPSRRYKTSYINHIPYDDVYDDKKTDFRVVAAIHATSADGLNWKVVSKNAVHAKTESFEVSGLYRFGDFYYSTGQSWIEVDGENSRMMIAYRSPDFETWSEAKATSFIRCSQLAHPPGKGQEAHIGAGLWNRNNLMVGLYGIWHDGGKPPEFRKGAAQLYGVHVDLGLILSNDGVHFREPVPDFKIIARGKQGEWDDVALLQGHAFVNEGDQTMIWYSHWDTGDTMKSMEIGLALLRRDGFGYLSILSNKTDAHFITKPLDAEKKMNLIINVEGVSSEYPLTIELLDHLDRPLPDFSGSNASVITKNGTQVLVKWPGKPYLPSKKKFACKVNFPLNSIAKVYSMQFTKN